MIIGTREVLKPRLPRHFHKFFLLHQYERVAKISLFRVSVWELWNWCIRAKSFTQIAKSEGSAHTLLLPSRFKSHKLYYVFFDPRFRMRLLFFEVNEVFDQQHLSRNICVNNGYKILLSFSPKEITLMRSFRSLSRFINADSYINARLFCGIFFLFFSFRRNKFDKTCILKNARGVKAKKEYNDPRHDCPRCSSNSREKRKRAEMKEDTKVWWIESE